MVSGERLGEGKPLGVSTKRTAANDNSGGPANPDWKTDDRRKSGRKWKPKIYTDIPDTFPTIEAEIDLIEAYLSDFTIGIIANDNDQ